MAEAICDRPAGAVVEVKPLPGAITRPADPTAAMFGGEQDPACPHFQHWEGAHEC